MAHIPRYYRVVVESEHATDVLPGLYTNRKIAESAGAQWKRDMVAVEPTAEERRTAREEYSYEVVEAK